MVWWLIAILRLAWGFGRRSGLAPRVGVGVAAGLVAVMFQFWFDVGTAFPVQAMLWFLAGLLEAMARGESHEAPA
jgi:hypothetical protein